MARRTGLPIGIAEGSRVGAFTIVEAIGAGPAAYAFYAEDANANGAVLRFLRPELAREKDWVAHFTTAAKALSKVAQQTKQKRLLPVLGIGFHGDIPYVVEEYAGERSLAYVLYHEGVQFAEAVRLTSQVADVLGTLHAASPPLPAVAVRPADVFIERRGSTTHVTVAHCGILKSPNLSVPAVRRCFTVPAAECFAPEVLEGAPPSIAGDIYSLGMLLLRMIRGSYGVARFVAARGEGLLADVFSEDEPTAADDVMQRCLARDPAQRYASVDQLMDALDAIEGKRFPRTRRPKDLVVSPPPKPVPGLAPELEGDEIPDDLLAEDEGEEGRAARSAVAAPAEDEFDYGSFFESLGRQAAAESAAVSEETLRAREWEEQQRAERERKRQARRRGAILTLDEAAWDAALRDAGVLDEDQATQEVAVAEPEPEAVAEEVAVAEPEPEVVAEEVAVAEPEPEAAEEEVAVAEPEPEAVAEEVAVAEPEPEVVAAEVAVAEPEPEVVAAEVVVAEPEPEVVAEEEPEPPEEAAFQRAPLTVLMLPDLALAGPFDARGPGSNGELAPLLDREVAQLYRGVPGPVTFRTRIGWVGEEQLALAAAAITPLMDEDGSQRAGSPLAQDVALLYPAVEGPLVFRAYTDVLADGALSPGDETGALERARGIVDLSQGIADLADALAPSDLLPPALEAEIVTLYRAAAGPLVFRARLEVLLEEELSGRGEVPAAIAEGPVLAIETARLYPPAPGPPVFRARLHVVLEEELSGRGEVVAAIAEGLVLAVETARLYPAAPGPMAFRSTLAVIDEAALAGLTASPTAARVLPLSAPASRVSVAELAAAAGALNPLTIRPAAVSADIARLYDGVPGAITYRPHFRPLTGADLAPATTRARGGPRLVALSADLLDVSWRELAMATARSGAVSAGAGLVDSEVARLYPAAPVQITYRSSLQVVVLESDLAAPEPRSRRRPVRMDLATRLPTMPWSDLSVAVQRAAPGYAVGTPLVAAEVAGLFPALLPYMRPRERAMMEESLAVPPPSPRWVVQMAAHAAELRVAAHGVPSLTALASALDTGVESPLVSSQIARLFPAPGLPVSAPRPRRRRPGSFAAAPGAHAAAEQAPPSTTPEPTARTSQPREAPEPIAAAQPAPPEAARRPPTGPPRPTLAQLMLGELAQRNQAFYTAYRGRLPREDDKRTNILGLDVARDWSPDADLTQGVTVDVSSDASDIKVQFGEEDPFALDLTAAEDEEEMIPVELSEATAALNSVAALVRQAHQAFAEMGAGAGGELIDVDPDSDFMLTVADMVRMSQEATIAQGQSVQTLEGLIGLSGDDDAMSFDFEQLVRSQFAEVEEAETDENGLETSAGGGTITVADLLSSEDGIDVAEADMGEGIAVSSDAKFTLADILSEKRAEEAARKRERIENLDLAQLDIDATAALGALTGGLGLEEAAESADTAVTAFEQWKDLPGIGGAARRPSRRERTLRGMIFELMAELAIRQGDEGLDPKAQEALATLINAATSFMKLLPRKGG